MRQGKNVCHQSEQSHQLITSRSSNPSSRQEGSDSNDQTIRDANDAGGKSNVKEKQPFIDLFGLTNSGQKTKSFHIDE
jgi:hypothetical protein